MVAGNSIEQFTAKIIDATYLRTYQEILATIYSELGAVFPLKEPNPLPVLHFVHHNAATNTPTVSVITNNAELDSIWHDILHPSPADDIAIRGLTSLCAITIHFNDERYFDITAAESPQAASFHNVLQSIANRRSSAPALVSVEILGPLLRDVIEGRLQLAADEALLKRKEEAVIDRCKDRLKAVTASEQELADAKAKKKKRMEELKANKSKVESGEAEVRPSKEAFNAPQAKYEAMEHQLSSKEGELGELRSKHETMEAELDSTKSELKKVKSDFRASEWGLAVAEHKLENIVGNWQSREEYCKENRKRERKRFSSWPY